VSGGADVIYFRTAEILEQHGHSSVFFAMQHPQNLPCITTEYFVPFIDVHKNNIMNYMRASFRNLYSFKARQCIARLLDRYSIDLIHAHDIHRQMSPSILYEIKKRGIPVVMTLHNYKMICPSFIMMIHGKPCEACGQGKYFNALKLRCIKNSFFRSLQLSIELYLHHRILDIYRNVDVFIAPSMFLKEKHDEMGFKKRMAHLPYPLDMKEFENVNSVTAADREDERTAFVYFGRLETEKGLVTLFEAIRRLSDEGFRRKTVFHIFGEGSIQEELHRTVREYELSNVVFHGFLKGDELFTEIKKADVVIIPSEWYENYPVSVMEAFALGRPVVGARIGGIPEMVKDHQTGLTFESGNAADLGEKIRYVLDNPDKLPRWGKNARRFIEREVNPERHYEQLMEIYSMAMRGRK
jgi:glycosyltransferase involved in cell wall biosynthesis